MAEEWKTIDGFNGYYEVSSLGRIRSTPAYLGAKPRRADRIIAQCITRRNGRDSNYPMVKLLAKTYNVHRLVAAAFCERGAEHTEVNHINGDKSDIRAENLEWCTASENQLHAIKEGLRLKRPHSKINPTIARTIRRLAEMGVPYRFIADIWGISKTTISKVSTGKSWAEARK